jgi:hypothetical protein
LGKVIQMIGVILQRFGLGAMRYERHPISLVGHSQTIMSTTEQRFQSFITRVRPQRVAVFTNIVDPYWQESCLGIIEYFTKLWGGTHCIIVPTDGNQAHRIPGER